MGRQKTQQGYAGQRVDLGTGRRGEILLVMLLRTVLNLKLMNCLFLEFSL
jgi:hypothetical protein